MTSEQTNKFTYKGFIITRHAQSYTQHSAEIVDKNGLNIYGGNIAADIGTISGYKTPYGTDGRANPFMSTDQEIKACIDEYMKGITERAPGMVRKLADANVKDLSPAEVTRAFKDVAMPKYCITITKTLISAGIIKMDQVNALLQGDRDDRTACILQDLRHEINQTLYFFVETDMKLYKHITPGTVEAFKTQNVIFPSLLNQFVNENI